MIENPTIEIFLDNALPLICEFDRDEGYFIDARITNEYGEYPYYEHLDEYQALRVEEAFYKEANRIKSEWEAA